MEKFKTIAYILLPFVLIISYAIYYISYSTNKATDKQVEAYIKGSSKVKLKDFIILSDKQDQYTHFFAISSYPKVKYEILLQSKNNKFFVIGDYDHKQSVVSAGAIQRRAINANVNQQEYNNPAYGTRAKPIPVLYFADADSPDDIYIDDAQYHKNVKEYLTYDKKINSKK